MYDPCFNSVSIISTSFFIAAICSGCQPDAAILSSNNLDNLQDIKKLIEVGESYAVLVVPHKIVPPISDASDIKKHYRVAVGKKNSDTHIIALTIFKQIYFENPTVDANNAILDELEAFADAINTNTTPIVTLAQGTEALRIAMQVIENFKEI